MGRPLVSAAEVSSSAPRRGSGSRGEVDDAVFRFSEAVTRTQHRTRVQRRPAAGQSARRRRYFVVALPLSRVVVHTAVVCDYHVVYIDINDEAINQVRFTDCSYTYVV